jgi:hemerythrin-like metal-binding protein
MNQLREETAMRRTASGDSPSVGVKMLDRDHRELSEILREIQSQIAVGAAGRMTSRIFGDLLRATRSHFSLEEEMMAATKFPGLAVHRLRHQWMTDQIESLAVRDGSQGLILDEPILQLFSESHLTHVHTEDLNYGLWLNGSQF